MIKRFREIGARMGVKFANESSFRFYERLLITRMKKIAVDFRTFQLTSRELTGVFCSAVNEVKSCRLRFFIKASMGSKSSYWF